MEFLEEMINLLKHTGNIKTTEDIKKEYGRANDTYDYFIEIYYHYGYHDNDYNIHYENEYFGTNQYNNILNKYNMCMEWIDGSIIGIIDKAKHGIEY
jgi:hypothetical protein